MGTPAQNRAADINSKRHRTPRVVRATWDSVGGNVTLVFDRDMFRVENNNPVPATGQVLVLDGDAGTRTLLNGGSWVTVEGLPRGWSCDDVVSSDPYTGPTAVIYLSGTVKALGRFPVPFRERCERVEPA